MPGVLTLILQKEVYTSWLSSDGGGFEIPRDEQPDPMLVKGLDRSWGSDDPLRLRMMAKNAAVPILAPTGPDNSEG